MQIKMTVYANSNFNNKRTHLAESNPSTRPAIVDGRLSKAPPSDPTRLRIPHSLLQMRLQVCFAFSPNGVTRPIPVTTTRRNDMNTDPTAHRNFPFID